ncbi:MAG: hypothetical protein KJ698_11795 [Actinobacteria bacterium]|nr:hypothetical protein [Actinomycetota bacterium]MBU1494048.1 hypothetical protein [Actinomycetota bacterium]
MDIAVNLVESYLRLSGYLTLTEFEVQARTEYGFETVTDVDIMALRLPGDVYAGDPHEVADSRLLLLRDPVLELVPETIDVIIGEVKQGNAEFNPGLRRHIVLHSMLRRVGWLYDEPLADVVAALQDSLVRVGPARGGGAIRTRLVAFGRSPHSDLNTIAHSHIVETLLRFFEGTGDAFKPVQFRDPAPAMLSLLLKAGFQVTREGGLGPVEP